MATQEGGEKEKERGALGWRHKVAKGKREESHDINVKWMNFFKMRQDTLKRQGERGSDILRLFLGTLR